MSKKEQLNELFETLSEALSDARHNYSVEKPKRAKEFMDLADKTIDAIKLLDGDDWECREPHCAFKHNSRGKHE